MTNRGGGGEAGVGVAVGSGGGSSERGQVEGPTAVAEIRYQQWAVQRPNEPKLEKCAFKAKGAECREQICIGTVYRHISSSTTVKIYTETRENNKLWLLLWCSGFFNINSTCLPLRSWHSQFSLGYKNMRKIFVICPPNLKHILFTSNFYYKVSNLFLRSCMWLSLARIFPKKGEHDLIAFSLFSNGFLNVVGRKCECAEID